MPIHKTEYLLTARDKTRGAFKSAESGMDRLDRVAARTAIALAATGAAVFAISRQTAAATRNTIAYSETLEISVETMSRFEHAFSSVGLEADKTGDILKDVNEKIGDAFRNNAGEAVEVLEKLGISIYEIGQLSPDEQLLAIAAALDEVQTRGEKVQVLEALSNDASLLLPLLENNAEGLRELAKEADATGRTLTRLEAERIREADEAMRKLDAAMAGFNQELTAAIGPDMAEFVDWLGIKIPVAADMASSTIDTLGQAIASIWAAFNPSDVTGGHTQLSEAWAEIEAANKAAEADQPEGLGPIEIEGGEARLAQMQDQFNREQELIERNLRAVDSILTAAHERRHQWDMAAWQTRTKMIAGELEATTRGVAQESRTMFEINKAAGITNAIINTYQGVSESLAAYPMPLAAVMAAIHLAAGLQTVRSIESTSFGSKGGGAPSLAGSTPGAQNALETPTPLGTADGTAAPSIQIIVQGNVFANDEWREAMVENIRTALDNDELVAEVR